MSERRLREDLENSLISIAVSDMLEEYGKQLTEEYKQLEDVAVPDEASAKKFEKALNKHFRKEKLCSLRSSAGKAARYAVTACAALIIIVSVSIISVDAFRLKFLEWLSSIHSSHTVVSVVDPTQNNNDYNDILVNFDIPSDLPRGYKLTSAVDKNGIAVINFEKSEFYISITAFQLDQTINVDNENTNDYEEVAINNYYGYYTYKDGISNLTWHTDNKSFAMLSNSPDISKDELIEIAESIN